MDFPLHQRGERIIHHAMALHCALAGELRRYDEQPVMAAATGTGMARMLSAFVDNFDSDRGERSQSPAHLLLEIHFGNTCLNGLTATSA